MSDSNEALRLADRISHETDWYEFDQVTWCNEAAALLRQQAERIAELSAERDQLRAEVETLKVALRMGAEAEVARAHEVVGLRAEVERLRAIGSQLANVAFNWSQEANGTGQRLSADDRALLKSLQTQWDHARTTHKDQA